MAAAQHSLGCHPDSDSSGQETQYSSTSNLIIFATFLTNISQRLVIAGSTIASQQPASGISNSNAPKESDTPVRQASNSQKESSASPELPSAPQVNHEQWASPCPYHAAILNFQAALGPGCCKSASWERYDCIERFETEGAGDQHALFTREDTGQLSTSKDCTCSNVATATSNTGT